MCWRTFPATQAFTNSTTPVSIEKYTIHHVLFSPYASAMRREVDVHTFSHLNDTQNCDSSLVHLLDKYSTTRVWGRMQHICAPKHGCKCPKDVARWVFCTKIFPRSLILFWFDQTGLMIIAGRPEDAEPCMKISPHYFVLSFRLMFPRSSSSSSSSSSSITSFFFSLLLRLFSSEEIKLGHVFLPPPPSPPPPPPLQWLKWKK